MASGHDADRQYEFWKVDTRRMEFLVALQKKNATLIIVPPFNLPIAVSSLASTGIIRPRGRRSITTQAPECARALRDCPLVALDTNKAIGNQKAESHGPSRSMQGTLLEAQEPLRPLWIDAHVHL